MTRMRIFTRTLTAAALLAATSCGSTVRTGDSPMFLVINTLSGIRGGPTAGQASAILFSDVETFLTTGFDIVTGAPCSANVPCGVVYTDNGVATLELAKKDVTTATAPTSNNQVTINRIHVHYRVSPSGQTGVTAPADFDTFSTVTVPPTGTATVAFELVRSALKSVSPLFDLRTGGQIGVTADVTFFGTDQTGHAISATGSIQIEFANWGD
jgi:hypothetical protein